MNKHTSILSLNYFPTLLKDHNINKKDKTTILKDNNIDSIDEHYHLRIAEHTDVSMLTIVAQSSPGLEIYDSIGHNWNSIAYVRGALVVNIGDCLQYWSAKHLLSSIHRVVLKKASNLNDNNIEKEEEEVEFIKNINNNNNNYLNNSTIGTSPRSNRKSLAFFVSPNYDTILHPFNASIDIEAVTEEEISYSLWRKQRINSAIKRGKAAK
jgi:isopenicillin N synthase-like dioxygenase